MLYLASSSFARQELIKLLGIKYATVGHTSDEVVDASKNQFSSYVLAIAHDKMRHVQLPSDAQKHEIVFILTGDTLVRTEKTHEILGKPHDRNDAKRMLELLREQPAQVVTALVIERREWNDGWDTTEQEDIVCLSTIEFHVPQEDVEWYLTNQPIALLASGAGVIEGVGQNFLKSIDGSFSSVMGIPLFELRTTLKKMGCKI